MVPGIMIAIMFSISIGTTGLMFVLEKKDGLLERSWVAGMTTVEIMVAHILAKLLVIFIQISILLIMASYAFKVFKLLLAQHYDRLQ